MSSRRQPQGASPRAEGASSVSTKLRDRVRTYITHHREALLMTVQRIRREKIQTLLTGMVVAIALALPAILLLALQNFQALGEQWSAEPSLTAYLHPRAKPAAIDRLLGDLEADARVKSVRFISSEQALQEFETFAGFGDALAGLQRNPLPAAMDILLAPAFQSVADQRAFAAELTQSSSLIDEVSVDLGWVARFLAITQLLQQSVWILAALLALGAALVISNTIGLIIENRKDEIVVIKLVGGTDAFVKRPLIYTGMLYGIIGSALALMVVAAVQFLLSAAVDVLAASYSSVFTMQSLRTVQVLQLVALGALLGCIGAWVAAQRHLRKIEP